MWTDQFLQGIHKFDFYLAFPVCADFSDESFLPISFAMPLEVEVCLSGLVFQQPDLCKIKMGRAGLC